jgi:hypothetical protein
VVEALNGADYSYLKYQKNLDMDHDRFLRAAALGREEVLNRVALGMSPLTLNMALHVAAENGKTNVLRILEHHGADLNYQDNEGSTPLHKAVNNAKLNCVKYLLFFGANKNKKDFQRRTPLDICQNKLTTLLRESPEPSPYETAITSYAFFNLSKIKTLLMANAYEPYSVIEDDMPPSTYFNACGDVVLRNFNHNDGSNELTETNNESNETENNGNYMFSRLISNRELERLRGMRNVEIESNTLPSNAPMRCFDPIMANEVDIENDSTTFYIKNEAGNVISAGCLDSETLNTYKTNTSYIFFRCRDTLRTGALSIGANDVVPGGIRVLNFAMRIYVSDNEAQKLRAGRKYTLTPIEDLGRIVSYNMLETGNAVSSSHCGPADGSKLYKIKEILVSGGTRKKRSTKKKFTFKRKNKSFKK